MIQSNYSPLCQMELDFNKQISKTSKKEIIAQMFPLDLGCHRELVNFLFDNKFLADIKISRDVLARKFNCHVTTITRWVSDLEKAGYLYVKRTRIRDDLNSINIYRLTSKFFREVISIYSKTKEAIEQAKRYLTDYYSRLTLKANSRRSRMTNTTIKENPFLQKTCDKLKQNSVDIPQFSLDPPIPDF
jgi:DNA-binding MarR family transcriptional regulator